MRLSSSSFISIEIMPDVGFSYAPCAWLQMPYRFYFIHNASMLQSFRDTAAAALWVLLGSDSSLKVKQHFENE